MFNTSVRNFNLKLGSNWAQSIKFQTHGSDFGLQITFLAITYEPLLLGRMNVRVFV